MVRDLESDREIKVRATAVRWLSSVPSRSSSPAAPRWPESRRMLNAQIVRHQFLLSLRPGRPQRSLPEHLALIEAVCAGDAAAAERTARDHLASVAEALRHSTEEKRNSEYD